MVHYAAIIFERIGTTINPHVSSIMLALALIFGSLLSTYLADVFGRKVLIAVSLLGSAVGLFTTAFCHYLNPNGYDLEIYAWIPIISLNFVAFISSSGIMSLLFICSVEHLPVKVCRSSEILNSSYDRICTFFF